LRVDLHGADRTLFGLRLRVDRCQRDGAARLPGGSGRDAFHCTELCGPLAGSVYTYAQHGLHEVAGFFSGWLILLDYILVPALLYLFSAVALRPLLPGVPDSIWLLGVVGFNAVVNLI